MRCWTRHALRLSPAAPLPRVPQDLGARLSEAMVALAGDPSDPDSGPQHEAALEGDAEIVLARTRELPAPDEVLGDGRDGTLADPRVAAALQLHAIEVR
jgi:hypothetical protein